MGIGDRSFGRETPLSDEQAIERYRYMLRTAPPEVIERAHQEAFAQLTDQQRRMVLEELRRNAPEYERGAKGAADDPASLARMATHAEVRQPGTIERMLGGAGRTGGAGLGGLLAGGFLGSLAGTVVGSMIAQQFFAHAAGAEPWTAENASDAVDEDDVDMGGDDFDSDFGGDGGVEV